MPFVQRVITPVFLSRPNLHDDKGRPIINDYELEAINNHTLCFALKQLASVLNSANQVFDVLNSELNEVKTRSESLKTRIGKLQQAVDEFDPKNVTVPVGDMTWFSELKSHYKSHHTLSRDLFTITTRPHAVQELYKYAGQVKLRGKTHSSPTPSLTVTPVLGRTRRRQVRSSHVDIETRKPAVLANVRKWTSSEALGDLTTDPDATLRVHPTCDVVDHTLPSPEEQLNAIANKFPSEVVRVDTSGKNFDRMSCMRRSLVLKQPSARRRRSRRQRRNTIATTDPKEIHQAASESCETVVGKSWADTLEKKSQLEALKEWGLGRLRSLRPVTKSVTGTVSRTVIETRQAVTMRLAAGRKLNGEPTNSSSGNWSASSESGHSTTTTHHPRSSISSGSTCLKQRRPVTASTSSSVTSESSTVTPENDFETGSMYSCDTEGYYTSFHLDSGLKPLREEEPSVAMSSSSILSGSTLVNGDSEYELFGRGSTSTTASSAGTVCTALPAPPPRKDSHLSGNRTFPERRPLRTLTQTHSLRPADFARSDYVDLTQENLSIHDDCLTVDIHREISIHDEIREMRRPEKCGDSPDSGHNTCSSPVDSVSSPIDVVSECSDLEGVDRVERIREKTTINSSRIPSMCVITPPQSDDESKLDSSIDSGEYVTIAQVQQMADIRPQYVSLSTLTENSLERRNKGARVTLDSEGKVIYSSESLKRKKSVHTTGTFEPGPCVANNNSPIMPRVANIRPVQVRSPIKVQKNTVQNNLSNTDNHQSLLKKETNIQNDIGRNTLPLSPVKVSNGKQQYFPKSAYERETPCKPLSRPLSPLAKPIKSPVMSPKPVTVRAGSPTKSLSPIVSRGAYVRIQQPSDDLSFEQPHSAVKRSDSYRLANQEVFNPNSLGRRQYGPGIIASPTLLTALHEAQTPSIIALNEKLELDQAQSIAAASKQVDGPKLLQTSFDEPDHSQKTLSSVNSCYVTTQPTHHVTPAQNVAPLYGAKQLPQNVSSSNYGVTQRPQNVTPTYGVTQTVQNATPTSHSLHSNFKLTSPNKIITNNFNVSNSSVRTKQTENNSSLSSNKIDSPALTSTPTKNLLSPPLDFTTVPSPIEKSPPKNTRSGMDLFAIIHESKKRIQSLQKPPQINWPKTISNKQPLLDNKLDNKNFSIKNNQQINDKKDSIMKNMPKPMSPLTDLNRYTRHSVAYSSLPRMKIQNYEESPKNLVQRKFNRKATAESEKPGPTSTQDFKRLLLQTGSGNSFRKESAVDRLKNKVDSPIKRDIKGTCIPEEAGEDQIINTEKVLNSPIKIPISPVKSPVMVSARLVNNQSKAFQSQNRLSPTLETSL